MDIGQMAVDEDSSSFPSHQLQLRSNKSEHLKDKFVILVRRN
jgi:hypothetical protein